MRRTYGHSLRRSFISSLAYFPSTHPGVQTKEGGGGSKKDAEKEEGWEREGEREGAREREIERERERERENESMERARWREAE